MYTIEFELKDGTALRVVTDERSTMLVCDWAEKDPKVARYSVWVGGMQVLPWDFDVCLQTEPSSVPKWAVD